MGNKTSKENKNTIVNLSSEENKILSEIEYDINYNNKKLICNKVLQIFIECYPNINFQINDFYLDMVILETDCLKNIVIKISPHFNHSKKVKMNKDLKKIIYRHNGYNILYEMFKKCIVDEIYLFRYFHRCIVRTPKFIYELLAKYKKSSMKILNKDVIRIILKQCLNDYLELVCDLTIKKYKLFDNYECSYSFQRLAAINTFINTLPDVLNKI